MGAPKAKFSCVFKNEILYLSTVGMTGIRLLVRKGFLQSRKGASRSQYQAAFVFLVLPLILAHPSLPFHSAQSGLQPWTLTRN